MVVASVVVSSVVFGVCFRVVCGLSGFVGGLGGRMRLVPAWSAGMTLSAVILPIGVGGLMLLPVVGNDNFVCRLPFVSLSFAGVTFVCLVFYSQHGDQ